MGDLTIGVLGGFPKGARESLMHRYVCVCAHAHVCVCACVRARVRVGVYVGVEFWFCPLGELVRGRTAQSCGGDADFFFSFFLFSLESWAEAGLLKAAAETLIFLQVSVCLCMHVYVCIMLHMHVYVCICMYVYAYACICMHMHAYVCICMYVYVCMHMLRTWA